MVVVLDTNVFISALFWKGPPHEILKLAEKGIITIASASPLLEELLGVLTRRKFQQHIERTSTELEAIRKHVAELVRLYPVDPEKISVITRDRSDNMFLACALSADADYIISGDDHLLSLASFQDIPIVAPHQFLAKLAART